MVADGLAPALNMATGAGLKPHTTPFLSYSPANYFALILCLMVGTAALPHVLMRYFTTPSVREARVSVAWSLFFIFLLYFTAPAYAAFSKLEVYTLIANKTSIADLPQWIYTWGKAGLVSVCGKAAASKEAVLAACQAIPNQGGLLRFQDLAIQADAIVISTPEIAGLPYVISGLVAAGGLAAALSTADGLLLAIANALSHDLYHKTITPMKSGVRTVISVVSVFLMLLGLDALFAGNIWNMTVGLISANLSLKIAQPIWGIPRWIWVYGVVVGVLAISANMYRNSDDVGKRLLISRVLLLVVAAYAAATAATRPADIVAMVAWAFSLAAAGIFPALVLGVWWKGTTKTGAIVGMIVGFSLCLFYLVITRYWPHLGVQYFGMSSNLNPVSGNPLISAADMTKFLADPKIADGPVLISSPLASRVGWFNINNISSALFSLPLGFFVIWLVSLFTTKPSQAVMDMVDAARQPKGEMLYQDKDASVVAH